MRRMLDPKTIEGGSGETPRHGYRIFIKGNFYYLAYTNKDYPWAVGAQTNIYDFTTNPDYKELRKNAYYPAAGYYKKENMLAILIKIVNNKFSLWGSIGTEHEFFVRDVNMASADIAITKLF